MERLTELPIVEQGGCYPVRIVISMDEGALPNVGAFITHVEVLPPARPAYKIWGHYDMTLDEAVADASERHAKL
jgi:hypothetical protein